MKKKASASPSIIPANPRWYRPKKDAEIDLIYLSWGTRNYGSNPLQKSPITGWNYTLILWGCPTFYLNDTAVKLKAGDLVIISPGTMLATTDQSGAKCKILTWIWQSPPLQGGQPESRPFVHCRLDTETKKQVAEIHAKTRREIIQPDGWTRVALSQIHLDLDILLARNGQPMHSDSRVRYKLARDFICQHPEIRHPVAALSEYLQISISTVKRIFAEHGSVSAKAFSHECRMRAAKRLLQDGRRSVKQVAYDLGYAYPNDFSRAYGAYFGKPPSKEV